MHDGALRFVVLCNSTNIDEWQFECIREAVDAGVATLAGVVVRDDSNKPVKSSNWKMRWKTRHLSFWRIFNRFYIGRYGLSTRTADLKSLMRDAVQITDNPVALGKSSEALNPNTIDFVKDIKPDFILRLGYGILRGDILDAAKYGLWSFHHGDPSSFRGQPPGFWEIYHQSPVTGTVLQVLNNELDAGAILHRGFFQTTPHSYVKTRDTIYFGASPWVKRTCAYILQNGSLDGLVVKNTERGPIYKQPSNSEMLRFLYVTARAFIRTQIRFRLFRQNWTCGVIREPIHVVAGLAGDQRQRQALESVQWMHPPKGQFYADPFGYRTSGTDAQILFERFDWATRRGEIAAVKFDGTGFGDVRRVLSLSTHLSYPYVIEDQGSHQFVPENSEARDVSAFSIDEQGAAARQSSIFTGCDLIDATFFEWHGKQWVFGIIAGKTQNTELHAFYADSLAGPWNAHPLNPVKTDISSARPAGTPFVHEGRLYRPAQDCASHYGSAVTLNEVVTLTETDFKEKAVRNVRPVAGKPWDYGLHTLSKIDDYTLIDGAAKNLSLF